MAAAGVIYLTPNEAFAPVHAGSGLYTGDMKFQRRELPIIMTRIAALMRDPNVKVEIISEAQRRLEKLVGPLDEEIVTSTAAAPLPDDVVQQLLANDDD